jgi:flagellar assembly factor FliW
MSRATMAKPGKHGKPAAPGKTAKTAAAPAGVGSDEPMPTIEFVSPMPGFPNHRRFVLVRLDDAGLVYWLTSAEDPDIRFLVVPPLPFFPAYAPEIDDETARLLELTDDADALLLLVVSAGESTKDSTANLMAPIVIDQRARRAVQVVLTGSGYPVRAGLVP